MISEMCKLFEFFYETLQLKMKVIFAPLFQNYHIHDLIFYYDILWSKPNEIFKRTIEEKMAFPTSQKSSTLVPLSIHPL